MTATYENIIQHLDRPCQISDDSAQANYEFKKKIVLNYDKLDLARKLDEMTKTVNDFKNHYQGDQDKSSAEENSDNAGQSRTISPMHGVAEQVLPYSSTAKKNHAESIRKIEDYK